MYCNYYWGSPVDDAQVPSMGAMVSGASLMENVARMALALTATDEVDGIDVVQMENEERIMNDVAIYDLSGRRILHSSFLTPHSSFLTPHSSLPPSLYIIQRQDGTTKKVLIK
jgi:hypothetical protein